MAQLTDHDHKRTAAPPPHTATRPPVSVVICAYTERRLRVLQSAVRVVRGQLLPGDELIVVVDHNDQLLERTRTLLALATDAPTDAPGGSTAAAVRLIANDNNLGLSGARNAGIAAANGALIAFLDDDAVPRRGWLAELTGAFADEHVIGTGGVAAPAWERERPNWLPEEFLWVVGCSYRGLPQVATEIRNPIGANMAFRHSTIREAGGFTDGIGRIGRVPLGCEETEFSIRAARVTGGRILQQPAAEVDHLVTAERVSLRYFLQRCWAEGISKAFVTRLTGGEAALANERRYTTRTLPAGVAVGVRDGLRGDADGFRRAAAIIAGFAVTAAGYLRGSAAGLPQRRTASNRLRRAALRLVHPAGTAWSAAASSPAASSAAASPAAASPAAASPASASPAAAEARSFAPLWSGEIELTEPATPSLLSDSEGRPFERARILVRAAGTPLGFLEVECPEGRLDPAGTAELARAGFGTAVTDAIADDAWARTTGAPVSIVLCTHNRPGGAARTLESLLELRYPWLEIIVVDNARRDDSTRGVVERVARRDPRVRYVREDRKGLSCARNRGLHEAGGRFVAFTDDDVRVDPLWVNGLMRGFARAPGVACVTGLVASAALERRAEQYFDQRVWWSSSCEQRVITAQRGAGDSPLHPYAAGVFGTGANFAADVSVLRSLGGFDECLGAGSPTQGGEDLDIFVRLVTAGYALGYEPSALVWHEHRVDDEALRRQMYAYGLGLTAYLTKYMLERGSRRELVRRLPGGLRHALALLRRSREAAGRASLDQAGMSGVELRGMLAGPFAYLRARRRADRGHVRSVAP